MLKASPDATELLATVAQSRARIARLTTLATRRVMNPEQHRVELEAARENERAAMELLSKKYGCKATFCDLVLSMNECAQTQTNTRESNETT